MSACGTPVEGTGRGGDPLCSKEDGTGAREPRSLLQKRLELTDLGSPPSPQSSVIPRAGLANVKSQWCRREPLTQASHYLNPTEEQKSHPWYVKSKDVVKGLDNQETRRGWINVNQWTEAGLWSKFNVSAVGFTWQSGLTVRSCPSSWLLGLFDRPERFILTL